MASPFSGLNISLNEFLTSANLSGAGDFTPNDASSQEWASQMARYDEAMRYFSGRVFDTRVDSSDASSPLLYPLQINLAKTMCLTQAANLYGQWEDELVDLTSDPLTKSAASADRADAAVRIIDEVWEASWLASKLYEGGLSLQVYGGMFLRAAIDLQMPHGIRVDKLMPYQVFVRYHPMIIDRIMEAYIVVPVDKTEASLAYGIKESTLPDDTLYLEHWTEHSYETFIGGQKLKKFSGDNPWGFVPIEYIPRMRLEGFYGLPLIEDLMGLQDELNTRLADIGDRINDAAHPIRWVVNYRGNPSKDFAMGADALWDLGQEVGSGALPQVGVLEGQPEPSSSFSFIGFMMDMTRYSSFTSPVAFGEDEGSQRSGVTLELRLWPMLQQAKISRLYLRAGLLSLHRKILRMVDYRDTAGNLDEKIVEQVVVPNFAQLVPRDRQMLVEEMTARSVQDLVSPEEAVTAFGVRVGTEADEIERIKEWLEYKTAVEAKQAFEKPPKNRSGGDSS